MTEDQIRQLLDHIAPLPENASVDQLQDILDSSRLQPDEKKRLLELQTQPKLRLIWAHPPQAGHDCVQTIEVRLPDPLKGLHPRLHVCFPNTFQRLSGLEVPDSSDCLTGTKTADDRKNWGLLHLQQYVAPEHVWRADMQFKLPQNLLGTYRWKFRIDFVECWGHADLHRLFEACYTVAIGHTATGETNLTIEADDFTNVTLPDLRFWNNVTIRASGNANLLKAADMPNFGGLDNAPDRGAKPAPHGVIIDPAITRVMGHHVTVVTPHRPLQDTTASIRGNWPATLTAELRISPGKTAGSPAGSMRTLRLHAARDIRLGRVKKRTAPAGQVHINDIVTDFIPEDFPQLSPALLRQRREAISAMNSLLTISADVLTIRNTGSPGSDFPGYTEVEFSLDQRPFTVALKDREEEFPVAGIRNRQVQTVQLRVGGSPDADDAPIPGYPLQLIPVLCWQDNDTNAWPGPESYVKQLSRLPSYCQEASKHGMDAVLIRHELQRKPPLPLHVMLLRQLWLGWDGLPIEDPRSHSPREFATARVLVASHEKSRERIFLVQPLREQHTLLVHSSTHTRPMRVQPHSLVPLHDADQLTLLAHNGTPLWQAEFSLLSREDA